MNLILSVTLIPSREILPGNLHELDLRQAKNGLLTTVRRAGLGKYEIIGGADISFNEPSQNLWIDDQPPWVSHWKPHWHLLFAGVDGGSEELRRRLQPFFPVTASVHRPIAIKPVTELLGAISYVYKPFFERRVSYREKDGNLNTRTGLPLKDEQQCELALALSDCSFTDRLFLRGFRRRGQRLVAE